MRKLVKILPIVLSLFTTNSFGQTDKNLIFNFQTDTLKVESSDKDVAEPELYFPMATRIDSNRCIGLSLFRNRWYSEHLRAMNEPILYNGVQQKKVFRFTWLRTLHNPIIIRIENKNDSISLFYKMTNGDGEYEPGKIIIDKRKQLTINDWNKFIQLVIFCNFWTTMPCEEFLVGLDGSRWILEGATDKYYQLIDEWSPDEGAYYDCCNFLIELTDLEFEENEKY